MSFKRTIVFATLLTLMGGFGYQARAQGEAGNDEYVDAGFVFYDGKYIEAPYRVQSKDLSVYIAGFQITPRPRVRTSLIVTEDPGIPEGLSKEVGLDDLDKIKWQGRMPYYSAKLAYLWRKYSKDEAQERMMAYYRSLPCIKEAVRVYGDGVRLTDYQGQSRIIDLYISESAMKPPPTEEELKQQVDRLADMFKERLLKDDCYFFFGNGTELSMAERKAVNVLREMRDILLDGTKDDEAKRDELLTIGLIPKHDAPLAALLVSNFEQNDQFDERLEALRVKIVEQYGEKAIHDVVRETELK